MVLDRRNKETTIMDVHCTTCNEPWDTYHLCHEVIHDTGLNEKDRESWRHWAREQQLSGGPDGMRAEFKSAGWEFGQSMMNVIHCPACPKGAQPNPEKLEIKAELEKLMPGDLDGLAATYENHGL